MDVIAVTVALAQIVNARIVTVKKRNNAGYTTKQKKRIND